MQAAQAACVAQKLWLLTLEAEEEKDVTRRTREAEKRRRKMELRFANNPDISHQRQQYEPQKTPLIPRKGPYITHKWQSYITYTRSLYAR